jgi:predicted O-linked N-acetylglucosamine transferase (SPINDLY family)
MVGRNVIKTATPHTKLLERAREQLVTGHFAEAETLYRQYLQRHPLQVEACYNLGLALHQQGRLDDAIACYRQALKLAPGLVEAHQNLGHAFHTQTRLSDAAKSYRQALALKPEHAELHNNLANVLKDMGQLDQAITHYEQALALNPNHAMAYNNLGNVFKDLGLLDEAIASFEKALQLNPEQLESLGNLLFVLSYHPFCPAEQYLATAKEFGNQLAARAQPYQQWSTAAVDQTHPLRVGLVSGDMRTHPVGYFLENLLQHIDPRQLTLVAYATKPQEDALTARIKPFFAEWRSLAGLSDQAAAQTIHADGIHILIDLAGHTAHNRLPIFAWKPAPVQVTWLGYFASTGVAQMDYLLADAVSVPPANRADFTETVYYLPDTRLCFTPPAEDVPVAPPPMLNNGYITFGCFQNLSKLNNQVLAAWARILHALPDAKLRLQNPQIKSAAVGEYLLGRLAEHCIAPEQVLLAQPGSRESYLNAHAEIDVILDTFPYPGGTTTCEALWMGVPTLTLAGRTMLARQGASLLACASLPEWIASDESDYVAKAISFASDAGRLQQLRTTLRDQVLASPLFDGARFARNFAAALSDIWAQHPGRAV